MNRADYDRYVASFNARDYDAVLAHFADRFELRFAGYVFRTAEEVRKLYRFLHHYLDESVTVHAFVSDGSMVALEADVRLEARHDLTAEALAAEGLGRLVALHQGEVAVVPQFIHYHLEGGRIVRASCAVVDPPS